MKHHTACAAACAIVALGRLPACRCGETEEGGKTLKTLPPPDTKGRVTVEEAIRTRRSVRSYRGAPLSDREISQLLWAAQGVTDERRGLRAAPSAGATYPLETYLITAEGVFRYLPAQHALAPTVKGDRRAALCAAALGQPFVRTAPVVIAFAAVEERTTGRYGRRGVMYIHMEAGHAAQNVHLQAVALGLGSAPVGAFDDDAVAEALDLPREQRPLYLIPVGR